MNNIQISFCIPTYNNAKSVHRLVTSILENDDQNIEVVVLDNGSTDETLSILQNIDDTRLSLHSNGVNKGALFNMMNVLDKGRGEYLVYSTDHDHIDRQKIDKFKTFLRENSAVSFGYCEFNLDSKILFETFPSGIKALNKLGYITRHPTGYFFRNNDWKAIDAVKRFSDYEFVDLFPLEFVFAELSLLGDGAVYYDSIFSPERGVERITKHKSATTKGNSKKAFFSPESRLKLAINFESHIQSLSISELEKRKLIIKSFFRELNLATFEFKNIMSNNELCIHYYMDPKNISKKELLQIGLSFYNGYSNKVINVRFKTFLERLGFKVLLVSEFIKKVLKDFFKSI
ncbi:glycosyltransferase family 2 protein [Flavobacterium psychroterrae]|uniref:Glycosyltransferase family 2 protein n=1 Tax=Flavobacterium psychroterrae TaxID=2133767 RepID=A0ABS5PCA2_9FLAO|nr:glycosyltransferase family 2 protein [Flavobacterium psychroterrae]MBS7231926.1 glycosyltransferase family 2 protein [Flavobacterium psychroterrae]